MTFLPLPIRSGVLHEADGVRVCGWQGPAAFDEGTCFGLVTETSELCTGEDVFRLRTGAWFVAPTALRITQGRGLAILVPGYRGLRQFGGPIEARGRLAYIDGCSDTLLVCPPRLGEPCLNHLHIPAATEQSAHTHPSARIGVIVAGRGTCKTDAGSFELEPGLGWYIPSGLSHRFTTTGSSLDVLAWHPDSDFGPTDRDHPMRNRTIL
jgi:mannose-6-phosphate isomerase-like protein (cupin superfamily)